MLVASAGMAGPSSLILSVVMIASALLAIGGVRMIVAHKERRKGALMLLAALVALGNVLVWGL
jgi:hypothetical protein